MDPVLSRCPVTRVVTGRGSALALALKSARLVPATRAVVGAVLVLALCSVVTGPWGGNQVALASTGQETVFSDNNHLLDNPEATLARLRGLGVGRIRVFMLWASVAPSAGALRRPRGFRAGDPASYPAGNWARWDTLIAAAATDGIRVDLNLVGPAPLWATGSRGLPRGGTRDYWDPSAAEFGAFVRAVAKRYSGSYDPVRRRQAPGSPAALPAVRFWSIWNEPNYGPSLAPQGVPGNLGVEHSPGVYRGLLDAAWSALRATGHRADTVLFGELAPRGARFGGIYSGTRPLLFVRALYCLDENYRPLRGRAATLRGCPVRPLSPAGFRAAHPALFLSSGLALHPYMGWYQPSKEAHFDPLYASLGELDTFLSGFDHALRAQGSPKLMPVWDTEFGYITSPPKPASRVRPYISPATASLYLNWAEYLHWRSPRLQSYDQYLLYDPVPAVKANDYGGFADGLIGYSGVPKPTLQAFRLPLYLPSGTQSPGGSLEVWGCARPAHAAMLDTGQEQLVSIQWAPAGTADFRGIQELVVTNPAGYFDTRVAVPGTGRLRLEWDAPVNDPLLTPAGPAHSRVVPVSVR